jgi:glycosyltransferase 2 family protein
LSTPEIIDNPVVREPAPQLANNDSPAREPSISFLTILWPILLGVGVLSIIGYFTFEANAFSRMVDSLNPWIMLGALGTVLVRVVMGGWRLSYVSHRKLSFRGGIKGQLAWDFASNVTPSLVGGAPIAAYYIARSTSAESNRPVRMGEVTAFMMFIMLLDQTWFALSVPIILLSAIFLDVIPSSAGSLGMYTAVIYFVGFMAWTGMFAYATLFRPELLGRVADFVCKLPFLRKFRDRVSAEMEEYQGRAAHIRSQPFAFYIRGLLLTGATWTARYLLVVFIVWSIFPGVDQVLLFLRSMAMTIGSLVMPTPGGAGGVEGLYVLFFSSMMPTAFLAPTLFAWRVLGYYIFLGFGVLMSTRHVQKSLRNKNSVKQ